MPRRAPLSLLAFALAASCGSAQPAMTSPATDPAPQPAPADAPSAVEAVLDDWHAAAAASDEERYFSHFAEDGVFLGTDATERWDVEAFRAYAHAPFEAGRGWAFEVVRRDVVVDGSHAWFDEDLASEHLGPLRGSGVLRWDRSRWRIAQYNLALTVPNEAIDAVREAIAGTAPPPE